MKSDVKAWYPCPADQCKLPRLLLVLVPAGPTEKSAATRAAAAAVVQELQRATGGGAAPMQEG